jgi:hypothetical protein
MIERSSGRERSECTKLSSVAHAGIGIGAGIAAMIVLSLILLGSRRRRGPFGRKKINEADTIIKADLNGESIL